MTAAPVVVAGGGIAGLSAALALAQAGRDVHLFEREPLRMEEGAGLQLSPNATRHLRPWGVLDALDGQALVPERVIVRRGADAAILSELDLRDAEARWGAPFRVAHRADLHGALMAAAEAEPRIALHAGCAIAGWRETGDAIVAETAYGSFEGAALVIADGVRSTLRERAGLTQVLRHSGRVAWRALAPVDACAPFVSLRASNLWLGPDAHLVHYPLRGGSVVNLVAIVADRDAGISEAFWSQPGDAARLVRRFADWHRDLRDLLSAATAWRIWPLMTRDAPDRLASGRVALAGDAAHPMMPFLAQGAAQAIEDAAALGESFACESDVPAALRAYETARLSTARAVVAASEWQATVYHLRGPAAVARDLAMRAAGPVGMARIAGRFWR